MISDVILRYSSSVVTGHRLLMDPSVSLSTLISLCVHRLCGRSFFAKNDGCGLKKSDEFSENLQNSWFLTQACNSLTLHPVASSSKNAVFLNSNISPNGSCN